MSSVEPLQTSSLDIYPLSSSSSLQAVTLLSQLFLSCAGPHGKNHVVRNTCGGHLTITSSCSRLLSSISFSRSELKLVVSAVTGHLQQYPDCGLFMTHMCLQLMTSVLDLNIPHKVASSAFLSFVSVIINYVKSDSCDVRVRADFSNVKTLLSYVRSVLTSKTLLNIQEQELNKLCLTILNSFVSAIPSTPSQRYSSGVFVLGQEKMPVRECKCMDGIMIECPELCWYRNCDELMKSIKSKWCTDDVNGTFVKVALVTCSMSGDTEDIVRATFEGTRQQFDDLEESVFLKMTSLCETLERQKVAIVLCQKVVHPKLKTLLKSKGIVCVDRLGSQPIPFLRDLTGCVPITSLVQGQTDCLGKVTSVSLHTENTKTYLCLKHVDASVVTLVICSEWEERLSELKHCVNTCIRGLESLAKEPWLLMGGGCWQMHCSQVLKEKVLSMLPELCEKLSCSESTLKQLLAVFRSCLHKWCLGLKHSMEHLFLDSSSFHCWRVSKHLPLSVSDDKMKKCSCGFKATPLETLENFDIVLMQSVNNNFLSKDTSPLSWPNIQTVDDSDDVVLDNLTTCVEGLHKAVLTAGLLLSVGQLISDRN